MEQQRSISPEGRVALAEAISADRDWSMRFSAEDWMIAAMEKLSVDDLEAAELAAMYLREGIACALIRHDMNKREVA